MGPRCEYDNKRRYDLNVDCNIGRAPTSGSVNRSTNRTNFFNWSSLDRLVNSYISYNRETSVNRSVAIGMEGGKVLVDLY